MSQMEEFKAGLEAQGLHASIIDSIMKQAASLSQPKPEKKKKGWFPGMATAPAKVKAEVIVTTCCQSCGDVVTKPVMMEIKENSPRKMKVGISICTKCPAHFRELTSEQLVSFILLTIHPGMVSEHMSALATFHRCKTMTPEEIVVFSPIK